MRIEIHIAHHLGLRRQVVNDGPLGSAQHQWSHALHQLVAALFVAFLFDRLPVDAGERFLRPKKSWRKEMKQRPEFTKVVFQRSP